MLMSVKDLEKDSGISRHTWRAWIQQERLPVVRLGRTVRVREEDYKIFIDANTDPPPEDLEGTLEETMECQKTGGAA